MIKKIAIYMIILIILLIIGGVFFFKTEKATAPVENQGVKETNKTEDTVLPIVEQPKAELQVSVYKDEKYGLQFQYPKDWRLAETDNSSGVMTPLQQENCAPSGDGQKQMCLDAISYEVKENKENLSIKDYFKNEGWREEEDYKDLTESMMDSNKIYKFTTMNAYDGSEDKAMWLQLSDGNFFAIQASYLTDGEKEVFENILTSVKLN